MSYDQSISNRNQTSAGIVYLPSTYRPETFPMRNGYHQPSLSSHPSLSFKNNRVAPPPYSQDYNAYGQTNHSYGTPGSTTPTRPLIQTTHMYPQKQSTFPSDNPDADGMPTSWWSHRLCFGLTRLSGTILFGTMIVLAAASIAGLITAVVLYVNDTTSDPQWKILGMVVCAVMLITVIVTFLIFIYCYKNGHIRLYDNQSDQVSSEKFQGNNSRPGYNDQKLRNDVTIPSYHHPPGNSFRRPDNYNNQPYNRYGLNGNPSSASPYENVVPVEDKLTNTENTISSLRLRDYKRGVWPARNAYGGISYRPTEPPKMTHRVTQALPNDIDQSMSQRRNLPVNLNPSLMNRQAFGGRAPPLQPNYEVIEEIYETPRKQRPDEYVEYIEPPKQRREQPGVHLSKPRYGDVVVRHVKIFDEANGDENNFNTDHFYN
ncbi:unnamed protein product [Adineta ricciae]|uniref:Uncharacterized protein n=1 Tax=Adineta ricciae TaxID=249248 RepID=A0A814IFQ9_ADIRI|nr:unnamed protein product [Adineta ricciae]